MSRTPPKQKRDPAGEAFAEGMRLLRANPALAAVDFSTCRSRTCAVAPREGLLVVDSDATVHAHPDRLADPGAWAWALAHGALHLGFGHVPAAKGRREQPDRYDLAARCVVVNRFLLGFPVGTTPEDLPASYPDGDEERLSARWRAHGLPPVYECCGTAGGAADQVLTEWHAWQGPVPDRQLAFATALTRTVSAAMDMAGGRRGSPDGKRLPQRPWEKALSWFVSSYPLLGGIAAGITLVADAELARATASRSPP